MSMTFVLPLLGFATAVLVAAYSIPVIIKVAFIRKIYDKPGGRKTHKSYVPNLGGIGIFAGFIISFVCWTHFSDSVYLQYLILGLIVLHLIGIKDDIVPLAPYKKLVGQFIAAGILVIAGKFRINDLHGLIGIHQLIPVLSIAVSILVVVLLINAFNLIDGIDGLAAGMSLLISLIFSYAFWQADFTNSLIAALALSGGLVGFLFYNKQPARIFMGDAGSMCIGYLMAAFSFLYMKGIAVNPEFALSYNPGVLLAFFTVPLFDTFRVFTIRIVRKKSPFKADNNHIHHKLQQLGLSHGKIAMLLTGINAGFIGIAYLLRDINPTLLVTILLISCGSLTGLLWFIGQTQKKHSKMPSPLSGFKIIPAEEIAGRLTALEHKPLPKKELAEVD